MHERIPYRALLATAAALATTAAIVALKSRDAERRNPPTGKFITVDGTRLHYLDRGSGEPLLLLHGNGAMAKEMELSGLVDRLARHYRVLAFDRPGYGHSDSAPRGNSPEAQAELLHGALDQLGIESAVVVAHSWGTLVALALALARPQQVHRLVLLSGYYFPTPRLDVLMMTPAAIPLLGTLLRHTLSPLLGRLTWPLLLRKLFSPAPTSERFRHGYPAWMTLRPKQLRSSATESVQMIPAAARLARRYSELAMPLTIIAGAGDLQVLPRLHAQRLHRMLPHSELVLVPGAGHMIHHTATARVADAIDIVRETAITFASAGAASQRLTSDEQASAAVKDIGARPMR